MSTLLLMLLGGESPALAGGAQSYMKYLGVSVNNATLPAAPVTIEAVTDVPMTSVVLSIGTTALGSSTTFVKTRSGWSANVPVDLSGRSGPVSLVAQFSAGTQLWTVRKPIILEAPAPAPAQPADEEAPVTVPPGALTTGVPDGTVLTPSGTIWITTPGAVVSNLDIDGCVFVLADNVTIRNSRIRCATPTYNRVIDVAKGKKGLVVEDVEIDGLGQADIGIGWGNYTLRRVDIHGTCDGARVSFNVLIEDSWIHDLVRQGTLHCDAVQSTEGGNITVRRNNLDPTNTASGDFNNAAVMLGTETGSQRLDGALFEGNWFGGGNYSVNVRGDAVLTDITFRKNVYLDEARYGVALSPASVLFEDNVSTYGVAWSIVLTQ
ncbi:hypothetical protein [Modestobacter sp. VKM Ac-2984]|uniref:hypothetical protein n=1 Tax=Modestobacter sp. VKM Ac-2984 TaxID=3004138 RepID=UPI0022AB2A0A|nr:hypothetical protein [Modestobacter sp. VKM Ac-2984]MCZ2817365.1 hypothetical protein [Modestobacter sp. VKM Ac-2984]